MSYATRLKRLNSTWGKTKPRAPSSGLPAGKYQVEITRAVLQESKARFNKGHLQVCFFSKVATGKAKGSFAPIVNYDLESDKFDGLGALKGTLEMLGIELKSLSEKAIKAALEQAIGCIVDANVVEKGGYTNTYFNRLVNAADDADEDLEEEDEDEDEDDLEEDEEEEEEEDEPDPPPRKKSKKKSSKKASTKKTSKKKAEPEPEEEDEDEDDEWEDEEWED